MLITNKVEAEKNNFMINENKNKLINAMCS